MIQKLQRKLILLSMTSLLLVLCVIVVGINVVNYTSVVGQADELLEILSENKGSFPHQPGDKGGKLPPNLSQETPYETRYFTVLLTDDGELIQTDTSRIVTVSQSEAVALAQTVLQKSGEKGFLDHFRYTVRTGDGVVRIIFLDCGRTLYSFRSFLLASIGISVLGYAIVFVLIAFFSHRIIRPVSESYEKQKRFITDAGHELKTPLTIISADADVLAMELENNEWVEDIRRQTQRLAALTGDLVYLSRMEESGNSLPMIEFPLSDVVGEAASSFQSLAQAQSKAFRFDIQPMLSLTGNDKAISQLVSILLDNALKYSPEGGSVCLNLRRQNKTAVLTVSNTTQDPIPKESLPKLFDRFYRADPSRSSQTGGYGIGLSIAQAIAQAHHGKIQASSEDGSSLTITVSLPLSGNKR
ncbi:MAG: sensor histidine kinase [Faecousia sp.]